LWTHHRLHSTWENIHRKLCPLKFAVIFSQIILLVNDEKKVWMKIILRIETNIFAHGNKISMHEHRGTFSLSLSLFSTKIVISIKFIWLWWLIISMIRWKFSQKESKIITKYSQSSDKSRNKPTVFQDSHHCCRLLITPIPTRSSSSQVIDKIIQIFMDHVQWIFVGKFILHKLHPPAIQSWWPITHSVFHLPCLPSRWLYVCVLHGALNVDDNYQHDSKLSFTKSSYCSADSTLHFEYLTTGILSSIARWSWADSLGHFLALLTTLPLAIEFGDKSS